MLLSSPRSDIEVWQRPLVAEVGELTSYWSFLSRSEQRKAGRFYLPRDVTRYIIGRGWMRQILAACLDEEPAALSFTENPFGKPRLSDSSELHFNLTHSHGYAVLVVAWGFEVGVDIERLRPSPEGVAEQFFSKAECDALDHMAPADRDESFFNCWTRKEAFVKALGDGLSFPLDDFSVSLAPGTPAAIEHIKGNAGEVALWQMAAFRPLPDFIGAVAARRRGWTLKPGVGMIEAGRLFRLAP
jgi:4'-phosphopantetheinyl transferase